MRMALQGPLVVIGGRTAPALSEALGTAGAFPIVEAAPADAAEIIAAAEGDLRFRLPPLLVQCYTEIGNGGFGPGHGLIGLESEDGDAFRHDLTDACLAELYTAYREEALRRPWPKGLLPLFLKATAPWTASKPPNHPTWLHTSRTTPPSTALRSPSKRTCKPGRRLWKPGVAT